MVTGAVCRLLGWGREVGQPKELASDFGVEGFL